MTPPISGLLTTQTQWPKNKHNSNTIVSLQISDPNNKRFEVPHEHAATVTSSHSEHIGNVLDVINEPFGLAVKHPGSTDMV